MWSSRGVRARAHPAPLLFWRPASPTAGPGRSSPRRARGARVRGEPPPPQLPAPGARPAARLPACSGACAGHDCWACGRTGARWPLALGAPECEGHLPRSCAQVSGALTLKGRSGARPGPGARSSCPSLCAGTPCPLVACVPRRWREDRAREPRSLLTVLGCAFPSLRALVSLCQVPGTCRAVRAAEERSSPAVSGTGRCSKLLVPFPLAEDRSLLCCTSSLSSRPGAGLVLSFKT